MADSMRFSAASLPGDASMSRLRAYYDAARREALLRAREDEKQRRKREALRCIAPRFEAAPLVLVKTGPAQDQQ